MYHIAKLVPVLCIFFADASFAKGIVLECQGTQTQKYGNGILGIYDISATVDLDLDGRTACYTGMVSGNLNERKCKYLHFDDTRFSILVGDVNRGGESGTIYSDIEINRFTGTWSSTAEKRGLGKEVMRYDFIMNCNQVREFESKKKF